MNNFIPNETILMDDRDPAWINKNIKVLIHDKKLVYTSRKIIQRLKEHFMKFKIKFD